MVPAQALKFVSEIERRQNHQVHRVDRLAVGANSPAFFVNRRRKGLRPLVAAITGDNQILPHNLDIDASHLVIFGPLSPKSNPSNRPRIFSILLPISPPAPSS